MVNETNIAILTQQMSGIAVPVPSKTAGFGMLVCHGLPENAGENRENTKHPMMNNRSFH